MRNKYGNIKVTHDGHKFDSKKEGLRYLELNEKSKRGEITELELQVKYPLIVNGVLICTYIADFRYVKAGELKYIVEDVKGILTPIYRLKKKLMKAIYGIEILES